MFRVVEEALPIVGPALPKWVPGSRAWLGIAVSCARHIELTVPTKVHVHLREDLLVLRPQVSKKSLGELKLHVQAVVHPLNDEGAVCELRAARDGDVDPGVFVRPRGQVREDLRLAAASLAPKETARVEALERAARQANPSNIDGPPVMVASLVVASQVELVVDLLVLLERVEGTVQVCLLQGQLEHAEMLHDLREIVEDQLLLVTAVHDGVDDLIDHLHPLLLVAEVWANRALPELLNKNVDEAVEYAWRIEELLIDEMSLARLLLVDIIDKRQRHVLVKCNIVILVLQDLLLHLHVCHRCDLLIINVSLVGKSEACQVIRDPQALLARLEGELAAVDLELVLLVAAIHNRWEHTLLHSFWEEGVFANVLVSVLR